MNLLAVSIACALGAMCAQVAVGYQRRRIRAAAERIRALDFGAYGALLFARTLLLTGAITYVLFAGVLFAWQESQAPLETETLIAAIRQLESARDAILRITNGFGHAIGTVVAIGLTAWLYRLGVKFARRLEDATEAEQPDRRVGDTKDAPTMHLERAVQALLSKGFFSLLTKGQRLLVIAGMTITLLSLIGAESVGQIGSRIVTLHQLTVERSTPAAIQSLEELKKALSRTESSPDSADDPTAAKLDEMVRTVALVYERALVESLRSGGAFSQPARVNTDGGQATHAARRASSSGALRTLTRLLARERVLLTYVRTQAVTHPVAFNSGISESGVLSGAEREALHRTGQTLEHDGAASELGTRIERDVRRHLEQSPGLRSRIAVHAERWNHAFRAPLTPSHFLTQAVGDFVDHALAEVIDTPSALDKITQYQRKLGEKALTSALERLYTAGMARYLERLARGDGPVAAAAQAIRQEVERPVVLESERAGIEEAIRALEQRTPMLADTVERLQLSRPTAESAAGRLPSSIGASPLEFPIKTYDDLFPGRARDPEKARSSGVFLARAFDFERVSQLSKVGRFRVRVPKGRPGPTGSGGKPLWEHAQQTRDPVRPLQAELKAARENRIEIEREITALDQTNLAVEDSAARYERSFRYDEASLYAKVGGVVIGRPPAGGGSSELDFVDLHWQRDADGIRIEFVRDNGDRIGLTRIREEPLVLQALSYAADGRPVAATLVRPHARSPKLQVLLHPVLLDTATGAAAIELDQLVDRYFVGAARKAAVAQFNEDVVLYHLTRLATARLAVEEHLAETQRNLAALRTDLSRVDSEVGKLENAVAEAAMRSGSTLRELFPTSAPLGSNPPTIIIHEPYREISSFTELHGQLRRFRLKELIDDTQLPLPAHEDDLEDPPDGRVTPLYQFRETGDAAARRLAEAHAAPIYPRELAGLQADLDAIDKRLQRERLLRPAAAALRRRAHQPAAELVWDERPSAFDPAVVRVIARCSGNPDLGAYLGCVGRVAPGILQDEFLSANDAHFDFGDRAKQLLAPEYLVEVVSGVREKPYRLDTKLHFATATGAAAPCGTVAAFDYVLQATFTPINSIGDSAGADIRAWPLPGAPATAIAAAVKRGVEADKAKGAALERMCEFTLLQRLFRAAFEGQLGENFPAYRLGALASSLSDAPLAFEPTNRWVP